MATLSCKIDEIICADGEALFCIQQGNIKNPNQTIVFIPGLGGGFTSTSFVIEELLKLNPDLRCITYDPRGQGYSTHQFQKDESILMPVLAKDLATVINHYHIDAPILIGHSLGGLVLQEYLCAELKPVPKKCIFISSTLSPKIFPAALGKAAYMLLHYCNKLFSPPRRIMTVATHLKHRNSFDFSLFRIYHDITTMGLLPFFFFWGSVLSWQPAHYQFLKELQPLLVFGSKDLIINKHIQEKIKQALPDSPFKTLPTNHNPVVNEPKLLAQAIQEYITTEARNA